MSPSRRFRLLFLGTLATATALVMAATGWLVVRPMWQEEQALRLLASALAPTHPRASGLALWDEPLGRDFDGAKHACESLRSLRRCDRAAAVLVKTLQEIEATSPSDFLDSHDEQDCQRIAFLLAEMGADAKEAVPGLIEALRAEEDRSTAIHRRYRASSRMSVYPGSRDSIFIALWRIDPVRAARVLPNDNWPPSAIVFFLASEIEKRPPSERTKLADELRQVLRQLRVNSFAREKADEVLAVIEGHVAAETNAQ